MYVNEVLIKKLYNLYMKNLKPFIKENWITILVLLYLVSPIDFIPEGVLPVIGSTDDAGIMLLELIRRFYLFNKSKNSPTE
ncbi:MAG: hypothetical protein Fur003_4880 [Candidatus Dojkabacteria bacterium]